MIPVRLKLVLLVLASLVPALVGAVAIERASEHEILEEAGEHAREVGERFDETIDDRESNARLALTFASQGNRFQQALADRDPEPVQRFVDRLGAVYKHRIILASDEQGAILGRAAGISGGPTSLDQKSSPAFGPLLSGQALSGLLAFEQKGGTGYALVNAAPVLHDGKQVGALALLSPINQRFIDYLKRQVGAELALSIGSDVIASTSGHPAPRLRSGKQYVMFEKGRQVFAVQTLRPAGLGLSGLDVAVTAAIDVTRLRDHVRAGLLRHLMLLGGAGIVALAVSFWVASRMGRSITSIAKAAEQVKAGHYVSTEVVRTRDELESLARHFNEMVRGLEERDRLKETFGRYVTRQVADHLMKGEQQLGGELVPVTILFSDIRSFTAISESMPPRELLDFLNEYFSGMVESVLEHNGVVDKFIGDAIMAVFGAPVPEAGDPLHAVRAALDMRARLQAINVGFRSRGLPEIRAGIGLHTGQVVAGNMGHSQRMEYTVIGDAVNLASRLEGMTKELECDVILSEDLFEQVRDAVVAEPLRKIKVKGRAQEVMVYRLVGMREHGAAA